MEDFLFSWHGGWDGMRWKGMISCFTCLEAKLRHFSLVTNMEKRVIPYTVDNEKGRLLLRVERDKCRNGVRRFKIFFVIIEYLGHGIDGFLPDLSSL